jgi:hypothetical protein
MIMRNGEYMALYNLDRVQANASNMQQLMLQNNTLPEWAKSKLTQSRSHLSNVADYKRSKPLGVTNPPQSNSRALLQLLGIAIVGTWVGAIPIAMLSEPVAKEIQSQINREKGQKKRAISTSPSLASHTKMVFVGLASAPFATASWWAGGASIFSGATKNNPSQMAAGAGLMALSLGASRSKHGGIGDKFKLFNLEQDVRKLAQANLSALEEE